MKYFKKFLAILLAISLLSCCCIVISSCANSFLSDAKFEFKLNADGKSYAVTDLKMHRGDIVEIPAKYKGKPVTAIADHAFSVSGSSSVKGYVLPDTIETIGERAFDNNYQLESVVLGNGVKTIGANAFDNCNSLLEIVLPDSLETIEKNAFYRCYSLKSINIPQNVKIIAPGAFEYCAGITELTVDDENQTFHDESNCVIETATKTLVLGCKASSIPQDYSSVTRIAERAFSRMGLYQIIIPENIVEMGSSEHGAFIEIGRLIVYNKSSASVKHYYELMEVVYRDEDGNWPIDVEVVDGNVFYWDKDREQYYLLGTTDPAPKEIVLPEDINGESYYVDQGAFFSCVELETLTIPASCETLFLSTFYNCPNLKTINYGGTEAEWNEKFANGDYDFDNATVNFNWNE